MECKNHVFITRHESEVCCGTCINFRSNYDIEGEPKLPELDYEYYCAIDKHDIDIHVPSYPGE